MLGLQTCLLAACTSDLNDPAAGGGNDLLETLRKPSDGDSELANRSLWVYGLSVPDFPGEGNLPTSTLPSMWAHTGRRLVPSGLHRHGG